MVNRLLGLVALVHVLRDEQIEAAGQREDAAARAARFELVLDPALIVELDEIVRMHHVRGPGVEIADDAAACCALASR